MIKFRYKVLRPFVVYKTDTGDQEVTEGFEHENSVSKYTTETEYYDYVFKDADLELSEITKKLDKLNFIKLVKKSCK